MNKEIDPTSFTPAYFQLAKILYDRIMSGDLRPLDRVPSENELRLKYDVSRVTARKAISILTEKGLVRREKGKGTFVDKPKIEGGIFLIPDFHDKMKMQGLSSDVKMLEARVKPAGKDAASRLEIRKGSRVIYLERILEGGGEPLVFDRKYILLEKSQPLLEAELGYGSIDELFSGNADMLPVRADLRLSATNLTNREARLLCSEGGSPAFCVEQLIFAINEKKIAWGWLIYRGDKFVFDSSTRIL